MQILIKKCPYCGNDYDFYSKDYFYGSSYFYYRFDGGEAFNGNMYDFLNHKSGKYAYCGKCDKRLFEIRGV